MSLSPDEKEKKIKSIVRRIRSIDKDLGLIDCTLLLVGTSRDNVLICDNENLEENQNGLDMDSGDNLEQLNLPYCIENISG